MGQPHWKKHLAIISDALALTPAATSTSVGTQVVVQKTAGGTLALNLPGSNRLSGQQVTLLASGYFSSGAGTYTATVQPILYGDASIATVTTKPLFSSTAGTWAYTGTAAAGLTQPWSIWATFGGDSVSQTFSGEGSSHVGPTLKAQTQLVAPVSAINFATEPPAKFAIGFTTGGTAGAATKFVTTQFQIIEE